MKDNQSANDFYSNNSLSSYFYLKQKESRDLNSEIYSEKNKGVFSSSKFKNLLLFYI